MNTTEKDLRNLCHTNNQLFQSCIIHDITTLLSYFNKQLNLLLITDSGPPTKK